MPAPDSIRTLCETFSTHLDHYKSRKYNETQVRREFLDPFFKALGWDVDNEQGYADAYKDVIHEDAIKIGGFTKAPDYCFRIGGTRKFFLEAKKPAVNIKGDIAPAYQLRRYAWSAKLPLSILSDFEELAVYDCRIRPGSKDKASKARILYYTFDQYVEKWDEIAGIFSRKAVLKGSFDKYAESSKKKRGTAEVDDAFLEEIERWRDGLARNFALRNPQLSVRDLNYAVQKTIDRLIFLRICEDRGTEDYGRLNQLVNGSNTWPRLRELFTQADARYNSGLFHFSNEKGRAGAPDTLTPSLILDDKVIKDIVTHLYYPESPYEFSVLPADILGQVYEQFLGKTIRLTSCHQAKIEEKPEVRKAGGVYYTPKYIVDYIVENTLGRLLNGTDENNPKPITASKAAKLKIVDPACGSGSFLIVAYQYLLDWHRDQYTLDPASLEPDESKIHRHAAGKTPKIYQARGGEWKLTTPERKRILLNNIHGVDIDSQAVEVTKLSLLLKVLEGETQQQLQRDFLKERQRILPDLGNNIQCGNSLIGPDFYDQPDLPELDDETQYKINVFDWENAFPDVFQQGGFDCVVGNPPYGAELHSYEQGYLRIKFKLAQYQLDTYLLFLEAASFISKSIGHCGFIIPNTWLLNELSGQIRTYIIKKHSISRIIDFRKPVFKDATVATQILVFSKNKPNTKSLIHVTIDRLKNIPEGISYIVKQSEWIAKNEEPVNLFNYGIISTLTMKVSIHPLLDSFWKITQGCKPFQTGKGKPPQTKDTLKQKPFVSKNKENPTFRPLMRGSLMAKYTIRWDNNYYISYGDWLAEPRYSSSPDAAEKLIIRQTGDSLVATLDTKQFVIRDNLYSIVKKDNSTTSLKYILALLNSSLMNFYYQFAINPEIGEVLAQVKRAHLARLPIRQIDFVNPSDVAQHDKIVTLVESMLSLHKKKPTEKNPESIRRLEGDITRTDHQIDKLVYELYDLTEEEIELVESSLA